MSIITIGLWVLVGSLLLWGEIYLAFRAQLTQHLLTFFSGFTSGLSPDVSFEQFLTMLVVACVLVMVLMTIMMVLILGVMWRALHSARRQEASQAAGVKHAAYTIDELKAKVQLEYDRYDRLITLSAALTQRLEKRTVIQNILQAASRVTTLAEADSIAGLWLLDFETDHFRFEMGLHCEETSFTTTQFDVMDAFLAKFLSNRKVLRFGKWEAGFPYLAPKMLKQLGESTALLLVPLMAEGVTLGFLTLLCHPALLAEYEEQETFFNAVWGQLSLGLSIAIQGELAIVDRLTGVSNKAYFLKRLQEEIERSNRQQVPLSLLMIDIDNFKMVNDTLGHPQGDAVLKMVARILKKQVRLMDLIGRYGGEEFLVMLPETGVPDQAGAASGAVIVAERIRKAVEEEFRSFEKPMAITVSIGVMVRRYPRDRQIDMEQLIRIADEQLYQAKRSGKNRYAVYASDSQPASSG